MFTVPGCQRINWCTEYKTQLHPLVEPQVVTPTAIDMGSNREMEPVLKISSFAS